MDWKDLANINFTFQEKVKANSLKKSPKSMLGEGDNHGERRHHKPIPTQ